MLRGKLIQNMDSRCLGFAMIFVFVSLVGIRLVDDWRTKFIISGFCLVFVFLAFVLDAFLSYIADETWKAKNLSHGNSNAEAKKP